MPRKQARKKAAGAEASLQNAEKGAEKEPSDPSSCPVAAFGASAGGLEAFTEVLQKLPNDAGFAIVFIQHLDPKHTSVLSELLSRSTPMPVIQVTEGMAAEPNHVYVIPPNTNITISKGLLNVQPRQPAVPHMPIDEFFKSLAAEQGGKAIGVVLSGTASDGTLGLKAIKGEGGITFAQSPESAKYDGMPRSAISAGCVDFVLTPGAIAAEIVRLCQHPYLYPPRPIESAGDSERDFNEIFSMLRSATGVDFSYYKPGTIRRRTLRRMALMKLDTPKLYARYLKENRQELDGLFQDLLINVTGFFREAETFAAIRSRLLPKILKGRSPDEPFRVWVPGCSTGEEVYSVAITVLEYLRDNRIDVPVQIFGTDLSEAALQKARSGAYPESIAAEVSPERLRRYFTRADGGYQITRSVRDACIFARQNVTKDPPFSKLDLITCRNLLIYLGPVLQSKVMRLFHYALKREGFLVLGNSEHIGSTGERCFEAFDKQHRIYSRKDVPAAVTTEFSAYEEFPEHARPRPPAATTALEGQVKVDRMILARYSPPAVVVNKDLKVTQFRGDTSPYLEHSSGEASLELTRLARAGLGGEIRRLVEKADTTAGPAKSDPIALAVDNEVRTIRVSVTPVYGLPEPQFLAIFEPAVPEEQDHPKKKRSAKPAARDGQRMQEMVQELASTRYYLQSVIEEQEASTEELKSAHEEVQSSNEELQSTNEELLTAKEELQSTNEELTTVNEEMLSRNMELQQINNDLLNLLSSANIPILMLGNDLRIRRFTPQAEKILNLIPADVGRPIYDFRLKINAPDVVALCQEVIDTLVPRESEAEDADGRAYSMWVRPYRTSDNRIEGVVLALVDVTERKRAAEARYRRLFEAAKDGIVIADASTGEIVDSNPFVTKLFGYRRAQLLGVKFWESDLFRDTEIDRPILAEVEDHESVQRTVFLATDSGERVEVDIVASLYVEGERKVVQFNIRDISERRRTEDRLHRTEDQFRQAQKLEAVGRLAAGVAHDFNNILTALLGHADLLELELADNHSAAPMVQEIRSSGERLSALTRQLLAFGRKQILNPAVISPREVISEMRQMITVMLSEEVQLVLDLPPNTGRVRADRTQLEQVVLNLALNARDAIADHGTITVTAADVNIDQSFSEHHPAVPIGRYVAITVNDTGTGMDQETQSHLFEPFFTTKPKGGGTGLGLSTVYNIVKQAGGFVWAYSELGVGSTFTVYLPRVEAEAERREAAPAARAQKAATETVLLVDDESAVRAVARRFLELRGYQVLEAFGGPDALRVSREHAGRIHLMVTDVVMPKMSGRELALLLAPERPDMKVLFMSGHTEEAISHHGVLEKGIAFLQKPFTHDALVTQVRALLDSENEPGQVGQAKAENNEK